MGWLLAGVKNSTMGRDLLIRKRFRQFLEVVRL